VVEVEVVISVIFVGSPISETSSEPGTSISASHVALSTFGESSKHFGLMTFGCIAFSLSSQLRSCVKLGSSKTWLHGFLDTYPLRGDAGAFDSSEDGGDNESTSTISRRCSCERAVGI
jgi:hypothetical protein